VDEAREFGVEAIVASHEATSVAEPGPGLLDGQATMIAVPGTAIWGGTTASTAGCKLVGKLMWLWLLRASTLIHGDGPSLKFRSLPKILDGYSRAERRSEGRREIVTSPIPASRGRSRRARRVPRLLPDHLLSVLASTGPAASSCAPPPASMVVKGWAAPELSQAAETVPSRSPAARRR
jgi:hypothetical protein